MGPIDFHSVNDDRIVFFFFWVNYPFKGVVHLKKTFADNLLTPMSSKMFMSFFLRSKRNKVFD